MQKIRKNNLSKYRKWKGLSQAQLSEILGICVQNLREIELGKLPKESLQIEICQLFGVSISQMFENEEEI